MERLIQLVGRERDVDEVARSLHAFASNSEAAVVGALHVTCSDESEKECIDAFNRNFVEYLLPSLKFGQRSCFRIANLGGRYESGAVHIAEDHYSIESARQRHKLLVVKINSHVGVEPTPDGLRFGSMRRYDSESPCCGALHALVTGAELPFLDDLRQAFAFNGVDRLRVLLNERQVPSSLRSLYAAVVNARCQAQRAIVDIQARRPRTPTLFVVLPCVTLNRRSKDTELVCGVHLADWRREEPWIEIQGLGDDPAAYRMRSDLGRLVIEDDVPSSSNSP